MSNNSTKANKVHSKDEMKGVAFKRMETRGKWCPHFMILLKKNFLLAKRSYRASLVQLAVPLVLTLLLFGLQYAVQNNQKRSNLLKENQNPVSVVIPNIDECRIGSGLSSCVTVAYTPSTDPVVQLIAAKMQANSGLASSQFRGYSDSTTFNAYMTAYPNTTQTAVHFLIRYRNNVASVANIMGIRYSLQYNTSSQTLFGITYDPVTQNQLRMMKLVEKSVFQITLPNSNVDFDYDYAPLPHPAVAPEHVFLTCSLFRFQRQDLSSTLERSCSTL